MLKIALVLSCIVLAQCENCSDNIECYEKELIKHVDSLDKGSSVPLLGDYLVLDKNQDQFEAGRTEEDIVTRSIRYLANHEVKLKIPPETARNILEGSRSSKLKKIILPLLLILKLKAAVIIPAVLAVIAIVAFNGLGAGLTALAIAGATGLKSLLEGHASSKFSYEVVPQYIPSHWSRAGAEPGVPGHSLNAGYHTIP